MKATQLIILVAFAWAAGCTSPAEQLLSPASGAQFETDIATIRLAALHQSSAVCYSTDGSVPAWNNSQCGDNNKRLAAPFASAAINLSCEGSSAANHAVELNLIYDIAGQPLQHLQASYYLDCTDSATPIQHLGTTTKYDSDGNNLAIARPQSATDDLLVLILHRSDDYLPLTVAGWTPAAQCYKRNNQYNCVAASDCVQWLDAQFCQSFGDYGQTGQDLAQAIFYKTVTDNEPASYNFQLNPDNNPGHPSWALLTSLRGANNDSPIRGWSSVGCDGNLDSLFPSVYAEQGDLLLLSQSYDDAIAQSKFGAPEGTVNYGYVSQSDESGFLFGGPIKVSGESGIKHTLGDGSFPCKDALISLAVVPK